MKRAIEYTPRGFGLYTRFEDQYGNEVTVQESSLATDRCVWVGGSPDRMHLTRGQATTLRDALDAWLADVAECEEGAGDDEC